MSWAVVGTALLELGKMLLQSLFDAGTNTLTDLMTEAITGAIGGIGDAIKDVLGVNSFLGGVVETFTGNLEQSLTGVTADLTNGINASAQQALGISTAQQDLQMHLTGVTDGILASINQAASIEAEQNTVTGAAMSDYLLQVAIHRRRDFENYGAMINEIELSAAAQDGVISTDAARTAWSSLQTYIEADIAFVEGKANSLTVAARQFLATEIENHTKTFAAWFRETVVIPISNYNAMVSALKKGLSITSEDVKTALGEMSVATYEYQKERLERGEIAPGIKVDLTTETE